MPANPMDAVEKSTAALKEALGALDAEKTRLEGELATVNAKHKALSTAVAALDPDSAAPKRRRGRPKKNPTAVEAIAAV